MGRVIRGWDEAIMQMTVGQTAGVFIQAPWVWHFSNSRDSMVILGVWQEGLPRSWYSTKSRLVFWSHPWPYWVNLVWVNSVRFLQVIIHCHERKPCQKKEINWTIIIKNDGLEHNWGRWRIILEHWSDSYGRAKTYLSVQIQFSRSRFSSS